MTDVASDGAPGEVSAHPALEVRSSPISGQGLFATAPIAAGTVVIRLGGRVVALTDLHRLFDVAAVGGVYIDTFAIGDDQHLVLPAGTVAHYGNHSCEPTMWPTGRFELATRQCVEIDDELTVDYALVSDDPTFTMRCTCGAGACRGVVTGEDWRRADLQVRYAGHWPPGLRGRIERAVGRAASSRRWPGDPQHSA